MAKLDTAQQPNKALLAEVQSNISKVPEPAVLTMVQCQSALYWGGNWSLISKGDADYPQFLEIYKASKQFGANVKAWHVKGGALLSADINWLLSIIGTLAPAYASQNSADFLERVNKTATEEETRFAKFWKRTREGKTDMFNPKDKSGNTRLAGTIGAYCTNVNNSITVNGIDYPAFKLPADAILRVIAAQPDANRVYVQCKETWVPLSSLVQGTRVSGTVADTLSFPIDHRGQVVNRPNALLLRFAVK